MTETVITRFAPSPTGFLHIGGARTALFNWLFAKAHGGKMLLRIEDTDRARSTDAAIEAILDGLGWLELDWDGEPVYQYARADRHREVADQLLAEGNAYCCYASPEELEAMRKKARAEGGSRATTVPGATRTLPWLRTGSRLQSASKPPAGPRPSSRTKFRGASPSPTRIWTISFFCGVMVLRPICFLWWWTIMTWASRTWFAGDDHLTNAARQTQLFRALGWDTPIYAHVPLIHGPDGAKLSKRHGALGVEAYREMGYLPVALRNYLVRLGWSHGDAEVISTEEMIDWFNLEAIGRSAARFDFTKLESLNGHYLRALPDAEIVSHLQALVPYLSDADDILARIRDDGWAKLERAMPGLKERAKTLVDLLESADYLFVERPLTPDEKPPSSSVAVAGRRWPRCCRTWPPWSLGRPRGWRHVYAASPSGRAGSLVRSHSRFARR